MTIALNRLYTGTHQYVGGTVQINTPFAGNTLAVELSTKPEYTTTKQVIGTLFQFYGSAQKAYDLYSGRDVVRLELPETDKLWFSPTPFLSDSYTLTIDYTDVGTIINGSNTIAIPEQILGLPVRVRDLETSTGILETDVDALQAQIVTLGGGNSNPVSWQAITNKPLSFVPESHTHAISEVVNLQPQLTALQLLPSRIVAIESFADQNFAALSGLQTDVTANAVAIIALGVSSQSPSWNNIAGKPSAFVPVIHTHTIAEVVDLESQLASINTGLSAKDTAIASTNSVVSQHTSQIGSIQTAVTGNTTAIAALVISSQAPAWAGITGKPLLFPPNAHTHALADVNGLVNELASKDTAIAASNLVIGQHTASISSLQTSVSNNSSAITANQAAIAVNTGNIANHETRVTAVEARPLFVPEWISISKPASTASITSASTIDDPHLSFAADANSWYRVELDLIVTCTAALGGLRFQPTLPSGAIANWTTQSSHVTGQGTGIDTVVSASVIAAAAAKATQVLRISMQIRTSTAGVIGYKFGQNTTAAANPTTVLADSRLRYRKL
jgi:Phage tail repeat like